MKLALYLQGFHFLFAAHSPKIICQQKPNSSGFTPSSPPPKKRKKEPRKGRGPSNQGLARDR